MDDTPRDRETCVIGVTTRTADGRLQVELAAGSSGHIERCRRPHLPVHDAREGPEWVDCNGGNKGWYSSKYDCYFTTDEVTAVKDATDDDVHHPDGVDPDGEGDVYLARCYFEHYTVSDGWVDVAFWFLPPGDEPGPTADPTAGLIAEALDNLDLYAAEIGTAPPSDGAGLVRLPVWLWNETDGQNWGTSEAQASEGGITAEATAVATEIVWHMGDGGEVVCDQGVPWEHGVDTFAPPCGYTYSRTSRDQPGGVYTVTAVTTWEVEWSVDGPGTASGALTLHPESSVELEIGEIQVLSR